MQEKNIKLNKKFRSPLIFDADKFSRRCKIPTSKQGILPTKTGFISKLMYVYILMAIDMILFAKSGNLVIFTHGIFPIFEVGLLLFLLFIFSFTIIGVFYKKPIIQNVICIIFTFLFIVSVFNQFYQLDVGSIIGNHVSNYLGKFTPKLFFYYSHIIIAALLSAIFAIIIFILPDVFFAIYTSFFVMLFFFVLYSGGTNKHNQHDFVETFGFSKNVYVSPFEHDKKFIYIMLPNLSSYNYFLRINNDNARYTYDLITGFYAKNKFEIYPNAFVENHDQFMNVVQSINTFDEGNPKKHIMDTMMLYRYWKFFNINDEYVFLKDNQMFDTFKKSGYKISAYKSRGIDICNKSHTFNVNRCMEKINKPVNLYDSKLSKLDRMQLLFIEWIISTHILNLEPLYKLFNIFSYPEKLPLIGINYNNLYVINSIRTFDLLSEHIISDKGKNAYFVYADIPSDMFIYDEFCNVKPKEQWVNMYNLPRVKNDNVYLKQQAYIDQTKCLYGKLQHFIDKLNKKNILNKSVLLINGMSSNNNFNNRTDYDIVNDFIYNNVVTLAIKSPTIKKFTENNSICSSKSIVHNLLYNTNICSEIENFGIQGNYKTEITNRLINTSAKIDVLNNIKTFDKWYTKWERVNHVVNEESDVITRQQDYINIDVDEKTPTLENITLQ